MVAHVARQLYSRTRGRGHPHVNHKRELLRESIERNDLDMVTHKVLYPGQGERIGCVPHYDARYGGGLPIAVI